MIKLIIGAIGIFIVFGFMTYAMVLDIGIIGALLVWGIGLFVFASAIMFADGLREVFG